MVKNTSMTHMESRLLRRRVYRVEGRGANISAGVTEGSDGEYGRSNPRNGAADVDIR